MKAGKSISYLICILGVIVLVALAARVFLRPAGCVLMDSPGVALSKNNAVLLSAALAAYASEYSHYPSGQTKDILKELTGDNPNRIVFLEIPKGSLGESGLFVDYWGIPFQIDLVSSNKPHVWSFGPN